MSGPILVYGAYGYTGALVAREAAERGVPMILAGRDPRRLAPLAAELGREARVFSLDDAAAVRRGLEGVGAVLHCAGPFSRTYRAVAEACLERRCHYLDLTGEIAVFQGLAAMGPRAEQQGVMLLPGTGFDIVPSDCLALHLARRLPGATRLVLAFSGLERVSRGTAETMLEGIVPGARAARRGPAVQRFDLGEGPVDAVSVPWADVFTAPRSTGILDVTVYMATSRAQRVLLRAAPRVAGLLRIGAVHALALAALTRGAAGPSASERARGRTLFYGEAIDPAGRRVAARQRQPDGYVFTARSAVAIAERVLAGDLRPGFQTPASAYGPDLVLAIPGVERTDLGTI